jgi:hypothetical protein
VQDLEVQVRLVVEPAVEVVLGLVERRGERAEDLLRHPQRLVLPGQHRLAQPGHRRRPLVRPDETPVPGTAGDRLPLGPDVDLFALVGRAAGALGADAAVPAEVR